jgi:hypothetical protein
MNENDNINKRFYEKKPFYSDDESENIVFNFS